jgi:hypothetical protein
MNLDEIVFRRGFFTKALWLRMQPADPLEARIGYRSARLADGWWLLFMLEVPRVDEFEVRGYSHLSGGVVQGHLPSPPDPRNAEQRLHDGGYDLARIKSSLIGNSFRIDGPERLAKVLPVRSEFGLDDYPPGTGIAQWTLTRAKAFRVAAFMGPGQVYDGYYV